MAEVIPCKRPKVTLTPREQHNGAHDAACHVPGCGWSYPSDRQFMALKSDATERATRHRGAHRAAVPPAYLTTPTQQGPEYDVYCPPCGGHRRTFATRRDAQAWIDEHLAVEHGVVVCDA